MNCANAKEKIDQFLFEKNNDLLKEVEEHTKNCDECASYFKNSLSEAQLIQLLKDSGPVLENPSDLTNSILSRIEKVDQNNLVTPGQKTKQLFLLPLFVRMLAAASVCLLLVFGVEQYTVVKKVSNLESAVNSASGVTSGSSMYAAQSPVFMLANASGINSQLINLMLERNNNLLQAALIYQSEGFAAKTTKLQQTTFLNSKLYKLISN